MGDAEKIEKVIDEVSENLTPKKMSMDESALGKDIEELSKKVKKK